MVVKWVVRDKKLGGEGEREYLEGLEGLPAQAQRHPPYHHGPQAVQHLHGPARREPERRRVGVRARAWRGWVMGEEE